MKFICHRSPPSDGLGRVGDFGDRKKKTTTTKRLSIFYDV